MMNGRDDVSEFDRDTALINNIREIEDCLSTTIKISHEQVDSIVINELLKKYKAQNPLGEFRPHFRKILRFYLSERELRDMLKNES